MVISEFNEANIEQISNVLGDTENNRLPGSQIGRYLQEAGKRCQSLLALLNFTACPRKKYKS